MNSIHGKLPSIGSLVKLKPYHENMSYIKVECLQDKSPPLDVLPETRDFPAGTLAMVVGHVDHPDDKSGEIKVPIILVEDFQGWIFNDEWRRIREKSRRHAT